DNQAAHNTIISILKLDATKEAARFRELTKGVIRLHVLKDLLPAPNELQKGISWPDPRSDSDAIIVDRNLEAAKYFLNAYELDVSPRSADTERALLKAIASLPEEEVKEAYRAVADAAGAGPQIASDLKTRFTALDTTDPALRPDAAVPGLVRTNQVRA